MTASGVRHGRLRPRLAPGWAAAGLLGLALGLPLVGLALFAGRISPPSPADWAALRFTLWQAAVSAALSCLAGQALARALIRRQFPGRGAFITLIGAPFILPVMVAILGLIALWGQSGVVAALAARLGLETPPIYGAHGVIIAHVFLNLPLTTRLFLNAYAALPPADLRLATLLGLAPRLSWSVFDGPIARRVMPGAFTLVFLFCTTSFAVALTLGGGPRATTLELAIYQAMRQDFDLARAVVLALLQCALAALVLAAAWTQRGLPDWVAEAAPPVQRWPGAERPGALAWDAGLILLAAAFLLLPLGLVVIAALPGFGGLEAAILTALSRSVGVALVAALVAAGLTLALLPLGAKAEAMAAAMLAVSPLVFGTGLYLLLRGQTTPAQLALPATALINALVALPLTLRITRPAWAQARAEHLRLSLMIGLDRRRFSGHVMRPELAAPLGLSMGLTAALSVGDLGVIVLLGGPEQATLPLAVLHLMRAYRMEEALAAATLLGALSLALLVAFNEGGKWLARIR